MLIGCCLVLGIRCCDRFGAAGAVFVEAPAMFKRQGVYYSLFGREKLQRHDRVLPSKHCIFPLLACPLPVPWSAPAPLPGQGNSSKLAFGAGSRVYQVAWCSTLKPGNSF